MRASWRAFVGIGLIGVYSLVMVGTEGSAPLAWAILAAAFVLLAVEARSVAQSRPVHRD